MDKPESSYAQVRVVSGDKEEEKFQNIAHGNDELDVFLNLLNVRSSVYDKVIDNQSIKNLV